MNPVKLLKSSSVKLHSGRDTEGGDEPCSDSSSTNFSDVCSSLATDKHSSMLAFLCKSCSFFCLHA